MVDDKLSLSLPEKITTAKEFKSEIGSEA